MNATTCISLLLDAFVAFHKKAKSYIKTEGVLESCDGTLL